MASAGSTDPSATAWFVFPGTGLRRRLMLKDATPKKLKKAFKLPGYPVFLVDIEHDLVVFVDEEDSLIPDLVPNKEYKIEVEDVGDTATSTSAIADMVFEKDESELRRAVNEQAAAKGLEYMLDTILSRLEETDVRLLMRVWSARTRKQESLGVSADVMKDMMKSEYIKAGELRMLLLEKDMLAAGISFPAIVRDMPDVSEELKYTRTVECAVGPAGGQLEIPGFVKLIVPPEVLQQDTMIAISTVDVASILRDPKSVNWISGYPWSLGEDACPCELLDQVLFSPAVQECDIPPRTSTRWNRTDTTGAVDVENDVFEKVVANVSNKWDDLARKLGFSRNQIKGIQLLEPDNDHRCREMLHRWRNREGMRATIHILKQALIDIDERLTAERL
uniref:Death domain-containing protein n=1 Tax=Branchiostoma floridae TaxID=7739 RepID=C3YXR1_BRAFL|eukprot:XP_002598858.1 hypothetical protein BRAFLDRAFT_90118 [Branchiostoma floridae]